MQIERENYETIKVKIIKKVLIIKKFIWFQEYLALLLIPIIINRAAKSPTFANN